MTHITMRRVALWATTIILVILGFVFFWLIRNVVFLIFVSILLATGIEPIVNRLRRGPFNRGMGILAVYMLIIAVLGLVMFFTIPPLIEEGQRFLTAFADPATAKAAIANIDNGFIKNFADRTYDSVSALIQNFRPTPEALTIGLTVFEVLFSAITVFVIAFYWLTERTRIKRFIFSFMSEENRQRGRQVWNGVEEKLGAWVRGQLVLMLFIGVLAGIGYFIMGLHFALPLAVFAGLTELIPLVGPYIGGAPAVLVALTQSPTLALAVAGYIAVLQIVEGNILVPRIMKSAVGVSPLTVIIGILVGSTLMGIPGALLAVPVAAAIQVILNHVLSYSSEDTPENMAEAGTTNTPKALAIASSVQEKKQRGNNSDDAPPPAEMITT